MSQYPVKALEAAGRYFVRNAGGIRYLTHYVVSHIPYNARGNLLEAGAREILDTGTGTHVYLHEREEWLHRHGIKNYRRDPDTVYNDIFAKAAAYLVYQYMEKHGYALYRDPKNRTVTPYVLVSQKTGKKIVPR